MKNRLIILIMLMTIGNVVTAQKRVVVTVDEINNKFIPDSLNINLGDTLVWESLNGKFTQNHTVTQYGRIPDGVDYFNFSLNSNNLSAKYIPKIVGIYDYVCYPHMSMGMAGTFIVGTPNGIESYGKMNVYVPELFPNPAKDMLNIAYLDNSINYNLTIYDEKGQSVFKDKICNSELYQLNIATYKQGTYTAHLAYCGCKPQKNGCGGAGKTLKFVKE